MTTPANIDSATLAASRLFLERIARSYDYAGAFLFGSRARKTHRTDSDADVAVLLRGMPAQFVGTKLAMDDVPYDVLLETGIRVQPLPVWEGEVGAPRALLEPPAVSEHRT